MAAPTALVHRGLGLRVSLAVPPVVLLDSFGVIMRLGLRAVLSEAQCLVLDHDCADGIDAVLFDMDQPACDDAARRLKATHPRARLIACSTRRPVMRVFEPGATADRPLTASALCAAVTSPPSGLRGA